MADRRSVSVFAFVAEPLAVLLLRRPASRAAGWQPVTGRVEPGDATLDAACVRELAEEAALPPPAEMLDLGIESEFVGYDGVTYRQRAFAARYATRLNAAKSEEHEELRWASLDEALALLRWDEDKDALRALVTLLSG